MKKKLKRQSVRWIAALSILSSLAPTVPAHTLTIMRVTPGKLAAGDTATVAARFEFDAVACAVQVDFGDGTPAQTAQLTDDAETREAPLSVHHVYAEAGAYMVSIVPVVDGKLPKCAGGKHSTLIEVAEQRAPAAASVSK